MAGEMVGPALQTGLGIYQLAKANKFAKAKRPNYMIPSDVTDNVNIAKNAYGASTMYGLPGQGKVLASLYKNQANSLNKIGQSQQTPASALGTIAAVDANTKNATNSLGVNAANFRAGQMNQTRGELMGAKNILAGYKDKEFKYNKDDPYQASMAAASALRGAAINNLFGGITSADNAMALVTGKKTPPPTVNNGESAGIKLQDPSGLRTQTQIDTGEQSQFPSLYDNNATYAAYRKKFPYSAMTDAEFYKAMADLQAGPTNTNPSIVATGQ